MWSRVLANAVALALGCAPPAIPAETPLFTAAGCGQPADDAAVRLVVQDGENIDAVFFDDGLLYLRDASSVGFDAVRTPWFERERGLRTLASVFESVPRCTEEGGAVAAFLTDDGTWISRPVGCLQQRWKLQRWLDGRRDEGSYWGGEAEMIWIARVREAIDDPAANAARLGASAASGCPEPAAGSKLVVLVESLRFAGHSVRFVAFDDGLVYFPKGGRTWFVRLTPDELRAFINELDPVALRRTQRSQCTQAMDASDPTLYVREGRGFVGRTIPVDLCAPGPDAAPILAAGARVLQFDHPRAKPWGDASRSAWREHVSDVIHGRALYR